MTANAEFNKLIVNNTYECHEIDWYQINDTAQFLATRIVETEPGEFHRGCYRHLTNRYRCRWFPSMQECKDIIKTVKGDSTTDGIICGEQHEGEKGENKTGYHADRHWCCSGEVNNQTYSDFNCQEFETVSLWISAALAIILIVVVYLLFRACKQSRIKEDRIPFAEMENDYQM